MANIGVSAVPRFAEKRKIKLVNVASLVAIPWFLMPTVRLIMHFDWRACVVDYIVALGSIAAPYLNYRKRYNLARFSVSFSNYIGMVALSLIYGRFLGTHIVLFAWLICNLYFFDNKRIIAFFTAVIALTVVGLEYYFHYVGAWQNEPRITIEYFAVLASITFFVVFAITSMYKTDGLLYSTTIEETNEALEQLNEEIIIQNEALNHQKNYIDEQKQRIESSFNATRDSIRYALNIQRAILKPEKSVQTLIAKSFIVYRPKDIVSGDFYWVNEVDGQKVIIVVDCTGHGVPGAFMTIVANSLLNEIVISNKITDPARILQELDNKLLTTFLPNSETANSGIATVRDGMDVAICCLTETEVLFAGAKRPLYYIIGGELFEEKGSRHAVGVTTQTWKDFETIRMPRKDGAQYYMFSDGVTDQFDSANRKRYSSRQFRNLLTQISDKKLPQQKTEILRSLYTWQGETVQTDDIVVLGFSL